ncbi:MAG TPA: 4-hydroxythreonine-4-phosphate dehydrogenase PdxA [Gammaproteobacteria bacterium]|jgi:4-hydroxythreonine-4-phosphate dehydrogenase|nr:4-hydroxythreonine-4-phosphate dehydrogenase PdxA [Gammaproteobacteria bacterium]
MSTALPRLALSSGEPAGVGPDVCIRSAQQAHAADITVLGDPDLLASRAAALGLPLSIDAEPHPVPMAQQAGHMHVLPVKLRGGCVPGQLDPVNAGYVIEMLERGTDACLHGGFDALVTAPVHKGVINDAGIPFTGHTEFLAQRCRIPHPVMLLAAGTLRVALATTHLPLKEVPAAVTSASLVQTLGVLRDGLKLRFGLDEPHVLVLGLNPHAGEGGHLGREELDVIQPACELMRAQGMRITGPVSADTAFNPARMGGIDVVLAMYHDQGLPVLKFAGFGHAVNITLGLPIVRTSVDHGTALELAATGRAEYASLEAALETAAAMVRHG